VLQIVLYIIDSLIWEQINRTTKNSISLFSAAHHVLVTYQTPYCSQNMESIVATTAVLN